MPETTCNVLKPENGAPIKAWTKGVPLEDAARQLDRGCRSCGQRHGADKFLRLLLENRKGNYVAS